MDDQTKRLSVEHHESIGRPSDENPPKSLKAVNTIEGDEALKVLQAYSGEQEWTDKEEASLRRKLDWRLMPVLCATYGLLYYDKAMLSQAALFGIIDDLGLDVGNRYSMTASIFYLGFIVGAYPTMYLAQRYPIERVASGTVILWGLCLVLTVICRNYQDIYAERFFLGALESGISPMFMLIVGSFYKKNEQAMRMGIWYSCTGYVSCISPLINYGFGSIKNNASTWRYMYYFAGGMTIVWGFTLYFVLLPDPVRAKGFEERERYIMVARLRTNNSGVRNTHFKGSQAVELATDPKFWLMFSIAFQAPISTFTPIIIRGFGFSGLNALLLVIPIGFYAGSVQLLMPFLAYKFNNIRAYLYVVAQALTVAAAIMLWQVPLSARGALLFACILLPSTGGGYAVLMGQSLANTAGYTKRSLSSSGLYIGYCLGNFFGPLAFHVSDAPRYPKGFIVVVVTAIAAGVGIMLYRLLCVWHNRKRDESGIMEGFEHAYEDDVTDMKNPQFRYIL
ncbi:hypothetical protein KVR01_007513 [Diaporthe batatas]|uniref:uncharacterized protein n=1 Tax=Diaporthe batatas TaxID=748121 RepID=UPI001D04583C|nr:uncharacterized protein KVR01_007513 [Diaporthe batatas]KAG8163035.1 hypothetical protein KVR01_007513 [Diaporthe batatas]